MAASLIVGAFLWFLVQIIVFVVSLGTVYFICELSISSDCEEVSSISISPNKFTTYLAFSKSRSSFVHKHVGLRSSHYIPRDGRDMVVGHDDPTITCSSAICHVMSGVCITTVLDDGH